MSQTGRDRVRPAWSAGFTLLELLVVMAIISLVAGMVVGFLPSGRSVASLRLESRRLEAGLHAAKFLAIEKNLDVAFRLNVADGHWGFRPGVEQKVADGIELAIYTGRDLIAGHTAGAIEFYSNGQSSGGHIVLRIGETSERLDVDWLTGRIHRHAVTE